MKEGREGRRERGTEEYSVAELLELLSALVHEVVDLALGLLLGLFQTLLALYKKRMI